LAISAKRYSLFLHDEKGNPILLREGTNNKRDQWSEHGLGHLLNPTDPESEDRDWIAQVWQDIIRRTHGLRTQSVSFEHAPAIGRAAYKTFDIATLGLSALGYCDGIAVDGSVYYIPAAKTNGNFLRYDVRKSFRTRAAWSWFDLTRVNVDARGLQSVAYIAPYLYLVPYFKTVLVRYDTTLPLDSASSYTTYDLSNLIPAAQARGLT
jgi:hypothetical protein